MTHTCAAQTRHDGTYNSHDGIIICMPAIFASLPCDMTIPSFFVASRCLLYREKDKVAA